ncbi:MEDS domain-containing protein [Streptomyces sp. Ru73]|uniref:MEDS domain-containing protein n=1 Tax=Streptomyces sp. Ru73 TaxID=2080748 RepID=UPI0015E433A5|nr:MEDS domain-containing protein [Streptomyces sp. Ru73]
MAGEQGRRGTLPVQRMRAGDHAFCRYSGRPAWDLVAAYAWQGLQRGEKVIICPAPSDDHDEVRARLEEHGPPLDHVGGRGQLVFAGMRGLLRTGRRLTAARHCRRLQEETERALAEGYSGLRLFSDMCWVADLGADLAEVLAREADTAHLFTAGSYSEVCAYDTDAFDPAVLDAVRAAHPHELLEATGTLRALHTAGLVRLVGEADMATQVDWLAALREAFRRTAHDGRLVVDLSLLHFLSVSCASDLLNLSTDAGHGRIEVRVDPAKAALLTGLGSHYLTHLVLVEDLGT